VTDEELAQVAYEAYLHAMHDRGYYADAGWEDLSTAQKSAWVIAMHKARNYLSDKLEPAFLDWVQKG
jgi:hypothetical protein